MKYDKRLLRLEKLVKKEKCIPAVALRFLNGTIHWAERIFPTEAEFQKAVERAFRNRSTSRHYNFLASDEGL